MRLSIFIVGFFSLVLLSFTDQNNNDVAFATSAIYDDSGYVNLILLRHAKSDKSNMNMADIERPLEASGRQEAKEMGAFMKENTHVIDVIFSSPSVRTKQTLEIICPLIGYDFSKVVWDSSLYACSGEHIIEFVKEHGATNSHVMIVGHNPSITDAANALQKENTITEVKTCGAVSIWFPTSSWKEISDTTGELQYYHKPK
jgi:phosphohistidine phosphatase